MTMCLIPLLSKKKSSILQSHPCCLDFLKVAVLVNVFFILVEKIVFFLALPLHGGPQGVHRQFSQRICFPLASIAVILPLLYVVGQLLFDHKVYC